MNVKTTGRRRREAIVTVQALVEQTHLLYIGLRETGMPEDHAYELTKLWFVTQLDETNEEEGAHP